MFFIREIRYLYLYQNHRKVKSAGTCKLRTQGDSLLLWFYLKKMDIRYPVRAKICLIIGKAGKVWEEAVLLEENKPEYQVAFSCKEITKEREKVYCVVEFENGNVVCDEDTWSEYLSVLEGKNVGKEGEKSGEERREEDRRKEEWKKEERRGEDRRSKERRIEEWSKEERSAEDRREEGWKKEEKRGEDRRSKERRIEEWSKEKRSSEDRREEERREEDRREEDRREEDRREEGWKKEERSGEDRREEDRRKEGWKKEERREEWKKTKGRDENIKNEERKEDHRNKEKRREEYGENEKEKRVMTWVENNRKEDERTKQEAWRGIATTEVREGTDLVAEQKNIVHIPNEKGEKEPYYVLKPEELKPFGADFAHFMDNSFLLHGFYNYHHILLGPVKEADAARMRIGVPGNYYHREEMVAAMFDFLRFVPVNGEAKTGAFGYYFTEEMF